LASNIQATFLKVLASAIVDKYIGESARVIREMFGYAREHQPCVIFMDEVDAIGGSRFSEGGNGWHARRGASGHPFLLWLFLGP
jgi:26S proteasome regulatory subunit T4